jgi:hypothetical protein
MELLQIETRFSAGVKAGLTLNETDSRFTSRSGSRKRLKVRPLSASRLFHTERLLFSPALTGTTRRFRVDSIGRSSLSGQDARRHAGTNQTPTGLREMENTQRPQAGVAVFFLFFCGGLLFFSFETAKGGGPE